MSLFSWFKEANHKVYRKPLIGNDKHQLNQAMWPTAKVRDSLLESNKPAILKPNKTSNLTYFDVPQIDLINRN
ncbi:hypothetical protein HII17_14400 [Thalassotalea sp. M1531]|uniref:Uncharacterized protein n=1 Tax=Thalassotalea algicola TaxID=2716224 RepID=A0A7Y0Q7U3_9GAMM|nr:hypothetical protein [Thalassotalea algicola]NMP32748.1 hypothetical protein [Thalassotalea algicola]